MGLLLSFAVPLVLVAVITAVNNRRAADRRAQLASGERTEVPCRVRGPEPPYPHRFRSGKAIWSDGTLAWRANHGGSTLIPLHDLTVLRTDTHGARWSRGRDGLVVHALTGSGKPVDLLVQAAFHPVLVEMLDRARHAPTPLLMADTETSSTRIDAVRRIMPLWAAVSGLLAAAWLAFWAWSFALGDRVQADVLSEQDELCDVSWTTPAGVESAEVDCDASTQPGDRVQVLAMPWPFQGEAMNPDVAVIIVLVGAAVLASPPVITATMRRRRRRSTSPQPVAVELAEAASLEVPTVEPWEVSFESTAAAMAVRSRLEGWPEARPDLDRPTPRRGQRWWQVPPLRRAGAKAMAQASLPFLFTVIAALFGFGWWMTSVSMSFGDVATTEGTVTDVLPAEYPLLPDDVSIQFQAGGRTVTASVATNRHLEVGEVESVTYDMEHPRRARLVSGDSTRRGAVITMLVAALTAALGVRRLGRVGETLSVVVATAHGPGLEMRYVLFRDGDGTLSALLFHHGERGQEIFGVPLAEDVRGEIPVSGTATVRGELPEEVGNLVPEVDGRTLWPAGFAVRATQQDAAAAVNGDLFYDSEPDT